MIEFTRGNLNIYEGQDIPVLTNDPNFPQMNAINDYWLAKGGRTPFRAPYQAPTVS